MQAETIHVKKVKHFLEAIADFSLADHKQVKCYISNRIKEPYCVANKIYLPLFLLDKDSVESLARSFLHELQHANDYLDNRDDGKEEKENRALKAERSLSIAMIESLWELHNGE
jgi:hypothetical protein